MRGGEGNARSRQHFLPWPVDANLTTGATALPIDLNLLNGALKRAG